MRTERTKTFEELQREASERWAQNTKAHAARMQTMQEQIAQSPDVQQAPILGSMWSNDLVRCPCGGHVYEMRRWACINGKKYRTEVRCIACNLINTWDFEKDAWLVS